MLANHEASDPDARVLVLMRGLPSCGKTTTARELVRDGGTHIEFDEYYYTQVGGDPTTYDWSRSLLSDARTWNMQRVDQAIERGDALIVLDDNNALGMTTSHATSAAVEAGYTIEFREPTSTWWKAIRELLRNREDNRDALNTWAQKLALLSRGTHSVSVGTFLHRIAAWRNEITVEEILASNTTATTTPAS